MVFMTNSGCSACSQCPAFGTVEISEFGKDFLIRKLSDKLRYSEFSPRKNRVGVFFQDFR